MRRTLIKLSFATLAATACGGDSVAAPPPYPALSGTYQVTATFSTLPSNQASTTGTITFSQPSRNDSTLVGSAGLVVTLLGSGTPLTQITNARISMTGAVTFLVPTANPTTTWQWSGQLNGALITGTNVLAGSGTPIPGTFTMVKLGQ